jgi:hypothetical protein
MANQERMVKALARQRQALELRMAGIEYASIAKELGYKNPSCAHKAVKTALKRTLQEPADELRNLELRRLDSLTFALWAAGKSGNQGAIDRILRLMERRAKLLGLDKSVPIDMTVESIAMTMAEWRAKQAERQSQTEQVMDDFAEETNEDAGE